MADDDFDRNLIDVVGLKKYFPIRGGLLKRSVGAVRAVDDVSFYIKRGETLGLVGESGCGKTTVGRAIMMLTTPTDGFVFWQTPKPVVMDFSRMIAVLHEITKDGMTRQRGLTVADLVDKLLGGPSCDISEERKKHLCGAAERIRQHIARDSTDSMAKSRQKDVYKLIDEVINEVMDRYCINIRETRRWYESPTVRRGLIAAVYLYLRKRKKMTRIRRMRAKIQFVFQDPYSSLDPKMLIKDIVAEPLKAQLRFGRRLANPAQTANNPAGGKSGSGRLSKSEQVRQNVIQLLEKVGLNVEHMYRYPHEFSGGQRQRIGIARALSVNPEFVVLDEPTSALDVSVQAQILNQLNQLQNDFGLTYLFISHDLSTIRYMCDRVAVMYLGKIAEYARKTDLFERPTHPYTEALLSVIPVPDPDMKRDRIILPGDVPSPANPPPGCRFHTRCPVAIPICKEVEPPLIDIGGEHFVACHVRAPVAEVVGNR